MTGLYQQILGDDFERMARVLKTLHSGAGASVRGTLTVRWARPVWRRLLLRLSKMPPESTSAECRVHISPVTLHSERWVRTIGTRPLISLMRADPRGGIIEQVGLISVRLTTWVDAEGRLRQLSDRVHLRGLGWPVPGLIISASEEAIDDRRFRCHVKVTLGRLGSLLSYEGVLSLQPAPDNSQGITNEQSLSQ